MTDPARLFVFAAGLCCLGEGRAYQKGLAAAQVAVDAGLPASDALAETAVALKMLPMVLRLLENHPFVDPAPFRPINAALAALDAHHHSVWAQAAKALSEADVAFALLKGEDLRLNCYPGDLLRQVYDLDMLFQAPELEAAEAALRAVGFRQGAYNADSFLVTPLSHSERSKLLRTHYELAPYYKLNRVPSLEEHASTLAKIFENSPSVRVLGPDVYVVSEIDIHFNIALGWNSTHVWEGPRTLHHPVYGADYYALNPTMLVLFLCFRAYAEIVHQGARSPRLLIDVLAACGTFAGAIDWERLLRLGERYRLHSHLFYTLSVVDDLLEGFIPDWAHDRLVKQLANNADPADRGDILSHVLLTRRAHKLGALLHS